MHGRFLKFLVLVAVIGTASPSHAMESLRGILDSMRPASSPTPAPSPAPAAEQAAAGATAAPETPAATPAEKIPAAAQPPVVRVNVAAQASNFTQPWRKNPRVIRQGLGVVLVDGRILVTAELVADHIDVELEKPDTAMKAAATVTERERPM